MKIKYDSKVGTAYVYLTNIVPSWGIVDHTQELTDNVLLDWMKDGTLYGIDISGLEGEECEYDPQAAEFGWFLEHGWTPPEEARDADRDNKEARRC